MLEKSGIAPTIILVFLVILLLYYLGTRKPKGYPPGPKWLPVIGSLLEIGRLRKEMRYFSEAYNALSKKYGHVIGLKIGKDNIIILNDFESMKAMIMNENCDGRPIGPVYDCRTFGKRQGLLVVDGRLWVEQRRFILRHLRDLGFGRADMALNIESEAKQFVHYYQRLLSEEELQDASSSYKRVRIPVEGGGGTVPGVVVEMEDFFGVPVLNTLWCMMAGKRYNINDKELLYLQRILATLLRELDMVGCLFNHFPVLKYLAPEISGYKQFMEIHYRLWEFIKKELENHKLKFDPDSPKDLMDVYLQVLQSENPDDTFTESQLLAICMDLFMAGSETSAKALSFGFLYLVLNPEVQRKAQQEIDAVIGHERLPSLNDRPRLTYINAVVLESIRMFMGRTMNIPHRAIQDTYILGYKIPKDSMLVVNFNNILMGKAWSDPQQFRPERFIDASGKLVMPETYQPFSFGKRRCMGELMAKSNVFMITAALLQNFTFAAVPGEAPPSEEYNEGVTASPKPFRVLITKRT